MARAVEVTATLCPSSEILTAEPKFKFDAVVLSVAHSNFKEIDFSKITNAKSIVYDVKNFLDRSISDKTL